MYSVDDLFTKRLIETPEIEESYTATELLEGNGSFSGKGGVYVFYNKYKEPLYVGISDNVQRRVKAHLTGGGSRDLALYTQKMYVVAFYEDDAAYRDVYESYLIHTLQPRYNIAKTGRVKV